MGVRDAPASVFSAINSDARHWQITALFSLFCLSYTTSDFGAAPSGLAMAITGAMLAQTAGTLLHNRRATGRLNLSGFQWKSALVTSLSLSILLRATSPWFWLAAGAIGIGAKFLIRYRGKHLFNPACIGIVIVSLLAGADAWVSPGQWGQAPLFAAFAIGFAALVLSSAKRLDIALGFLVSFAAMLIGRAIYLGDPLSIPLHQLQSGALLVFAFFMITDPRSTPDRRSARLIFAAVIAAAAAWLSWEYHIRGAVLYALAGLAFLSPILDRALPARRFQWTPEEDQDNAIETSRQRLRARPRFLRV